MSIDTRNCALYAATSDKIPDRHTAMTTEERVARLEGEIEHMATKADIERVTANIERVAATLTWRMIIVAGIAQAIGIGALLQFLPRS